MTPISLTVRDQPQWDSIVQSCKNCEIYHGYQYHALNTEGEPILFAYFSDEVIIAFPLIKRKITNSIYYDLTCVYGYVGPIANQPFLSIDTGIVEAFKMAFNQALDAERCITIFSRLSPFSDQHHLLDRICLSTLNGGTLYMDLTMSLEQQREGYHKRLRRQIKKLRELPYVIKEAASVEEIQLFTKMYHQNMDRLQASPSYYFSESYFSGLLANIDFDSKLILIYEGSNLICGAMLFISGDIIRNHVSATAAEYVSVSPSKLMTDEISVIGRRLGKKIFHLGGGLGGKQDELYKFKSYFSRAEVPDHTWCYIRDEKAYDDLLNQHPALYHPKGFFPAYRQPAAVATA